MTRFRCPECGAETQFTARYGGEIISAYCLRHAGSVDAHVRPVYMAVVTEPLTALVEPELEAVAA